MGTLRRGVREAVGLAGSAAAGGLGFPASCGPNGLHLPKVTAPRAGGARAGLGSGTAKLQHPDALNVSLASAICLLQLARAA